MKEQPVFDIIETDHRIYTVVVDYVRNKMVMFYDLTNVDHPSVRAAVIDWKLNHFDLRFAVFVTRYYPSLKTHLPDMTVLNRRTIKSSTHNLVPTKSRRVKISRKSRSRTRLS